MASSDVRKGMPARRLTREVFERRFQSAFIDPAFSPLRRELTALTDAAWEAYSDSRKAPLTRKAGSGFADPEYELSVDWLAAREAIAQAQRRHDDPDASVDGDVGALDPEARTQGLDHRFIGLGGWVRRAGLRATASASTRGRRGGRAS